MKTASDFQYLCMVMLAKGLGTHIMTYAGSPRLVECLPDVNGEPAILLDVATRVVIHSAYYTSLPFLDITNPPSYGDVISQVEASSR